MAVTEMPRMRVLDDAHLRLSDIAIYGEEAVAAIYEEEGDESLRELLDSDSLGELESALVSAFLKAHERRRGKCDQ